MITNNWIKKQLLAVSLALSNVEKNALHANNERISDDSTTTQRHKQGMLSDDLIQGKLTTEVIRLRARTYKVLEASAKYKYKSGLRGYKIENNISDKIIGEPSDNYKVEMVVANTKVTGNMYDSYNNIDAKQYNPIQVTRDITPRFKLEDYTSDLYIKNIDDKTKLLEFNICEYANEYDKKTSFLIKAIEKAITNPKTSDILDIKTVKFITNNTLGVDNFLEFEYNILSFDKIVKFNGDYVVKFIGEPIINGKNIVAEYADEELDRRYANKEKRYEKLTL